IRSGTAACLRLCAARPDRSRCCRRRRGHVGFSCRVLYSAPARSVQREGGMLAWIKRLFAGAGRPARSEPAEIAQSDLSPAGTHTLPHGGQTVIPRPYGRNDPAADAFEDRLLEWLQTHMGVTPTSHAGTNTLFWKFEFSGHEVELAVIGQQKNTSTPPGP